MTDYELTWADLARRFADPPRDVSPVPLLWWSAERRALARLGWQFQRFAVGEVYNLVILNRAATGPVARSDTDDPPFFSEGWWGIFPANPEIAQLI